MIIMLAVLLMGCGEKKEVLLEEVVNPIVNQEPLTVSFTLIPVGYYYQCRYSPYTGEDLGIIYQLRVAVISPDSVVVSVRDSVEYKDGCELVWYESTYHKETVWDESHEMEYLFSVELFKGEADEIAVSKALDDAIKNKTPLVFTRNNLENDYRLIRIEKCTEKKVEPITKPDGAYTTDGRFIEYGKRYGVDDGGNLTEWTNDDDAKFVTRIAIADTVGDTDTLTVQEFMTANGESVFVHMPNY